MTAKFVQTDGISDQNRHREAVGGMWREIGELQFAFLVAHGLRPHHYLLDIGCGSLRGGVKFIAYLESGHYFGIDKSRELLEAGRNIELAEHRLTEKDVYLAAMDDFTFTALGQRFDYALAQSVFTHLPLNNVIRCILSLEPALVPGGKCYATFFENPPGKRNLQPVMHPRVDGPSFASYFDADPYHYDFDTFKWICAGTRLDVDYIGDWDHPRDQKMLVITRT